MINITRINEVHYYPVCQWNNLSVVLQLCQHQMRDLLGQIFGLAYLKEDL
jgi:hypothetical protein